MDETSKSIARPAASRSLHEAIRKARLEEAERLDRTADERDSEIARLQLLKAELESVFAQVPASDERFNLALVPSRPARLWIDLFSYAAVGDGSAYLFVRNSESGRRTLFSSARVGEMADWVTAYMAREIVRRERQEAALLAPSEAAEPPTGQKRGPGLGMVVAAFLVGLITGAFGFFALVSLNAP